MTETVAAGQLRAFIERIERVEAEIHDLNADKSEIYKEARGFGFDVKAIRQCVAARKLDSSEREERNAMFDLYWSALQGSVHVPTHTREKIEHFPPSSAPTPSPVQADDSPAPNPLPAPGNLSPDHAVLTVADGLPSTPSTEDSRAKNDDAANVVVGQAMAQGHSEQAVTHSAMTARTKADVMRLLRPHCQHPDDTDLCGGQGTKHCNACIKAAAESVEA